MEKKEKKGEKGPRGDALLGGDSMYSSGNKRRHYVRRTRVIKTGKKKGKTRGEGGGANRERVRAHQRGMHRGGTKKVRNNGRTLKTTVDLKGSG